MKRLEHIKEILIAEVQEQVKNLECVNAKELGEVMDMIKDIEEAIYYHTITEAMHEEPWDKKYYPEMMHDHKEGRSHKMRKSYLEAKEMHHDKSVQMQELEQYMKELSQDVVEMIAGASPEEKQLLKSKLTTLVSKIDQA